MKRPLALKLFACHIYYVGTRTLTSFLVTTPQGTILINSSSEAMVRAIVAEQGGRQP